MNVVYKLLAKITYVIFLNDAIQQFRKKYKNSSLKYYSLIFA